MRINADAYLGALRLPRPGYDVPYGGQELILGEVIGAMHPYTKVWLPFVDACGTLDGQLRTLGFEVDTDPRGLAESMAEVMYFGTPTIVDDKPLFASHAGNWSKRTEREAVRALVYGASTTGFRRIVCGLGSGDISVEERLEDLDSYDKSTPAAVVARKDFTEGDGAEFTDWVIVKEVS